MLLHILFIIGICVEAMTGAMAAGRKQMDFFGVTLIAFIAALGGGTVRDVLFNAYPLTWVEHPEYVLYTSVFALLTIFIAHSLPRFNRLFLTLDALGLATFVIIGTEKILHLGLSPGIAIISGMLTGISGGMLRDILCNDIPLVLRKELYAFIALGGALLLIALHYCHVPQNAAIALTLVSIFTCRMLAIYFHIELPKFDYSDREEGKK